MFETLDRIFVTFHFSIGSAHVIERLTTNFRRPNQHGLMVGFNTFRILFEEIIGVASVVEDSDDHGVVASKSRKGFVKTRQCFLVFLVVNELNALIEPRYILVGDGV